VGPVPVRKLNDRIAYSTRGGGEGGGGVARVQTVYY
jgi:hypothetical protein